jgi:putative toxin-antitoxin system antitoxin component (TIGR02293 family)
MARKKTRTVEAIRELAHQVRVDLGIEDQAAPDMYEVLQKLPKKFPQIRVEIVDNEKTMMAALARVDTRGLFIQKDVFENLATGDVRARFTIAHEIGHLILHREHSRRFYRHDSGKARLASVREEREAMIFASEFLMPAVLARYQTAAEIEKKFRVSAAAAQIRARELQLANKIPLAPAIRARPEIVNELTGYGFSEKELFDLVVPKRTLARRLADDEPLTVEETDKALRLERIAALAEKVFGDRIKAQRWMRKPKRSLSGDTPLAYLASERGARIVEEMLRRVEHGIFA